jgi:hypothetical protein
MEEKSRFAKDPTLTILEGYNLETIVDFFFGVEVGKGTGFPCLSPIVGFCKGTTGSYEITVLGTIEINVVDGIGKGDGYLLPHVVGCCIGWRRGGKVDHGGHAGCSSYDRRR